MNAKNYWFAFGVGVIAGAAVALLYAPQSGAQTRDQIRKGVGDAGDYLEEAGDYLKDQAERLSSEAHKAIESTRQQVDAAVERAGDIAAVAVRSAKALV